MTADIYSSKIAARKERTSMKRFLKILANTGKVVSTFVLFLVIGLFLEFSINLFAPHLIGKGTQENILIYVLANSKVTRFSR